VQPACNRRLFLCCIRGHCSNGCCLGVDC
jgi:hypothetical protein